MSSNLIFPESGQTTAIYSQVSIPSAVSGSYNGLQITNVFGSGSPLTGSGGTVFAAGSGIFTPAGYFQIQAIGVSGNPYVKVPFFT